MHDIEPFWNWRHKYTSEEDERSPFFGEEQMVATPAIALFLGVAALIGGSEAFLQIGRGYHDVGGATNWSMDEVSACTSLIWSSSSAGVPSKFPTVTASATDPFDSFTGGAPPAVGELVVSSTRRPVTMFHPSAGTMVSPQWLVVSHYLFFSEQWELHLEWHIMVAPDDWARISGRKGERITFMRTLRGGRQVNQ